jgi:hypothetical protein
MKKHLDRAFPVGISDRENGFIGEGMTLRDYFAAAVLPAVYTVYVNEHSLNFDEIAEDTYQLADAMLFARIKE